MANENMPNHHLSIHDFGNQGTGFQETPSGPKVVLLEKLEKLFKCSEKKSLTITTIMKVERALRELKVQSNRKNYESSNAGDLNDTDVSSGSTVNGESSIEFTTKRSDHRYSLYEQRSRSRTSKRRKMDNGTDDKFTNESSNESSSEQTNKVERPHYHENKRDRCSPFTRYDRSPQFENRARERCENRPRYDDDRSPQFENRARERCENRPRYDDRDRSSRNKDHRSPSTQYEDRHRSPRYEDQDRSQSEARRSRSHSSFERHEKRKKDRKTDRNRNEHEDKNNARYSYSDPWEEEDRKIGVAGSTDNKLTPENDSKDFLRLLRMRKHSTISPIIEEKTSSYGEHTSQNFTDVRSQLSTFIKSHLKQNDKPTSTQPSNAYSIFNTSENYEQNLTNDDSFLDSIANEETRKYSDEIDIDNEIINRIVAQSVNKKDKSSNNVPTPTQPTFDVGTVRQALATVQMNEKSAFNVNPEAQTQENSFVTQHYCPMSQCISCVCTKPTPKESLLSIPSSVPLRASQPGPLPASQTVILSTPQYPRQPPEPRQSLDPRPVPLASFNSYRLQSHQPVACTRPIQHTSPNSFNSSPGANSSYQASPFPEHSRNSAIGNRRSTNFYENKRAPLTSGEYKRQNATVPSTSGSVHNYTVTSPSNTVKSHPGVYRSNNNSISLPKVISKPLDLNFKIPKIPRKKDSSNKIHIIENWDLTPESVRKQLKSKKNSKLQDNLNATQNGIRENNWDSAPESVKNQSKKGTEPQDNNGIENGSSENSLSVDSQFTGASVEPVLKDVINPNNLLALVEIMGKLSDNNTFSKIKEMLAKCTNEKSVSNVNLPEKVAANLENSGVSKPTKKKHKNELDRLNDDINTMFIRDDVLSANGRRVSSQCKRPNAEYVHATSKSYDVISKKKQKSVSTPSVSHMDKSYKHSAESSNIQRSKSTPLQTRKPTKQVEKLVKKSTNVANKKQRKATKETNKSIKKRVVISEIKGCSNAGKRPRGIVDTEESQPKKAKVMTLPVIPLSLTKNNNTEWHSLKKVINCQQCDKRHGNSLVNHYVNVHPNSEVIVSRLPPEVAKCVFDSTLIEKCEVVKRPWYGNTKYEFKQFCFFCNVYKSMGKHQWIEHMSVHTGYYRFRCVDCNRKFSSKPEFHKVKEGHKIEAISLPEFKKPFLNGYICKLCNFVRFNKCEIKAHLTNEHENEHNVTKMFKEILFLSFVKKKKHEIEQYESESEDYESDSEDYGSESEAEHEKELEELYKEETEEECVSEEDYDSTERLHYENRYAKDEGWETLEEETEAE